MRIVLFALCCMIVVGLVVFTLLDTPQVRQPEIVSPRVENEAELRPLLGGGAGGEAILEFFPDPKDSDFFANLQDFVPNDEDAEQADPGPARTALRDEASDRSRLLAMIDDWVYIQFSQVGQQKLGRIHESRQDQYFDVNEGQPLENGIVVAQLTSEAASLRLGEALVHLRLAVEPDFFQEVKNNPRPLTPDEQKKAYEYYMRRYGEKFQAYSQTYTPPAGMEMPRRVNPQQRQQALQEYQERYGHEFQQEQEQFPAQHIYPEEQAENFRQYWMRTYPDRPMPPFESIYNGTELGPVTRMQDDE